jgi:hypothetical protein
LVASQAAAITTSQVDTFDGGDYQNWQGAAMGVPVDAGPAGMGDFALEVMTSGFPGGTNSRLTTFSGGSSTPVATQWTGNWTEAGVTRILFDVRNPNDFDLVLWLGIAGPLGPGFAGGLDSFVTNESVIVPPDDEWHTASFDVLPEDFSVWTSPNTAATALANVYHLRVIHSFERGWVGELGAATMFLDNIRAVPEPSSGLLLVVASAMACFRCGVRRLRH